jgi:hypothetical protein
MKTLSFKSYALCWISLLVLAVLAACGGTGDSRTLPKVFSSTLTGTEETPPNNSAGKGAGILVFHPDDKSFTATVVTTGVADTIAHIHEGAPGVAGPIIFPLTKLPGSVQWKASGTLTPQQEASLKAGNYYFNVHSAAYPEGEVRGQITERALSPEQQQLLQQRLQQAVLGAQGLQRQAQAATQEAQAAQQQQQSAQAQAQAARQQAQQQAQQGAQQAQSGGGTSGMTGTGTTTY